MRSPFIARLVLSGDVLVPASLGLAVVLGFETGIGRESRDARVVAQGATCSAVAPIAASGAQLLLALRCATPLSGKHHFETTNAATIKRYLDAPAQPLTGCVIHRNDAVECPPPPTPKKK